MAKIIGMVKQHCQKTPLITIGSKEKQMTLADAEQWLADNHGQEAIGEAINITGFSDDRDYYVMGRIVENGDQASIQTYSPNVDK